MARVFVARDEALGREIVVKVLPPELTFAFQAARKEAMPIREGGAKGEAAAQITQPGDNLGTPMYMAPEQAAGDPGTDQRADVYAWGIVAYELINGKHPFGEHISSPQSLLTAQMSDTPKPLTTTGGRVPRWVSDLVMTCLSKQKSMRPASGIELLNILNNPSSIRFAKAAMPSRRRF